MKIAIVYNRESKKVINLFGVPNREKYGLAAIKRIANAFRKNGHHVIALEGDKDFIDRLEEFMPQVIKGERPGIVFNLSYGIQGQARYTHVPSILEMVGIPYVGSGPLAHSLALDKVVAKMIFRQNGLPTPDFEVLDAPGFTVPDITYPLIVKPKNEAVSFGIKIVNNERELREAADEIFDTFGQPVLVEQYIDGREINVGLLGNNPPEAFLPAEILFGEEGPPIYTFEDKTRSSGREIKVVCPAPLSDELTAKAQELGRRSFEVLGCYDCARVDMRLDADENFYILEVNSLPSLGEHGSYVAAASARGLDFAGLVNHMVEVAGARYFGTPQPSRFKTKKSDSGELIFSYITERRDRMEHALQEWTAVSSRTSDPVGIRSAVKELDSRLRHMAMRTVTRFTDERSVWTWETDAGFNGGTLLVGHLDVPLEPSIPVQVFRRDTEWLYGEGIGSSRAPLVVLEFALNSLRAHRWLRRLPVGVLYYMDEGRDCRYSAEIIRKATAKAKRVLVLRPGNPGDKIIIQRRGQRKYRLLAEGRPLRLGQITRKPEVIRWICSKLQELADLSCRKERIAVSAVDIKTEAFPMLLPHRITVTILMSYPDNGVADETEEKMRKVLGRNSLRWDLDLVSDRPPMKERRLNNKLVKDLAEITERWGVPFFHESSIWPSVAGLVPSSSAVVCGAGPVVRDLYTSQEAVQRVSLVQRALLLAQFLAKDIDKRSSRGRT
ncbi:MAG: ATP-grasp domain-containing protein [Thermodesulfobacteriota bacterium]|nr:ATP-grasp domain-containing protein [Thermodesulfobacteriota bacterium]